MSLNYTSTCYEIFYKVKEILESKYNIIIKDYLYLHGNLGEEITLGVANTNQVLNADLVKNCHPVFVNQIIKNRRDMLTTRKYYQKIDYMLNESNVIYCYGISFGETDSILINKLATASKHGKKLYVDKYGFKVKSQNRKSLEKEEFNYNNKDFICKKLKFHGQLNSDEYNIVEKNVIAICENCFEQIKNVI